MLCLGEALVDLICERQIDDRSQAATFAAHFGGAVANTAVIAARAGASVTLAGGAGEDRWGEWLRERLVAEGVDVSLFELVPGLQTALALVTIDHHADASYQIYGDSIGTVANALRGRLETAVRASAALFISSNTLVGAEERELTMRARALALGSGRPVIVDPNLRLHRWGSRAEAAASASAIVPDALLVRCNESEAALMTGEQDPERAARALLRAGAKLVVITLGPDGAILRGELRADVPGVPANTLSTVGAGDVLTGTLIAQLARDGFDPSAVAASLPDAVAASARACERWGALE